MILEEVEVAPSSGPSRAGWHGVSSYECPRKGAVEAILQPPRMSVPLARGSLVHIGLAHHYGLLAERPWAKDPIEAMRDAPPDISWTFAECRAILVGYRDKYRKEPFRVLDIEREFEIKIGEFEFTARLDLVVEQSGFARVIENKTGSDNPRSKSFERSGQIIGQAVIGKLLFEKTYGLPFGGIVINGLRTGEIRDYKRIDLPISERAIKQWPRSTYFWLKHIQPLKEQFKDVEPLDWPMNLNCCVTKYGLCPLYDACNEGPHMLADWTRKPIPEEVK